MGVASLILGILAALSSIFGGIFSLGWLGCICGLIAIILGAVGKKKGLPYSTAGLVLGIIALAWGLISTIACLTCMGATGAALGSSLF